MTYTLTNKGPRPLIVPRVDNGPTVQIEAGGTWETDNARHALIVEAAGAVMDPVEHAEAADAESRAHQAARRGAVEGRPAPEVHTEKKKTRRAPLRKKDADPAAPVEPVEPAGDEPDLIADLTDEELSAALEQAGAPRQDGEDADAARERLRVLLAG